MRALRILCFGSLLVGLSGCFDQGPQGHLVLFPTTVDAQIEVRSSSGLRELLPGEYFLSPSLDGASGGVLLQLLSQSGGRIDLPLEGVSRQILMDMGEQVSIGAETLDQPFNVQLTRREEDGRELFDIQLFDPKDSSGEPIADGAIETRPAGAADPDAYDPDSITFLRSLVSLSRANRGVFLETQPGDGRVIAPDLDTAGLDEETAAAASRIADFSDVAFIAPWLRARYSWFEWDDGTSTPDEVQQSWTRLFATNTVVDLVSASREPGAAEPSSLEVPEEVSRKRNHVRLAYSASGGGMATDLMNVHDASIVISGAVGGTGSRQDAFRFVRSWVYGESVSKTVSGPEAVISYTSEIQPSELTVFRTSIPKGDAPEARKTLEVADTKSSL